MSRTKPPKNRRLPPWKQSGHSTWTVADWPRCEARVSWNVTVSPGPALNELVLSCSSLSENRTSEPAASVHIASSMTWNEKSTTWPGSPSTKVGSLAASAHCARALPGASPASSSTAAQPRTQPPHRRCFAVPITPSPLDVAILGEVEYKPGTRPSSHFAEGREGHGYFRSIAGAVPRRPGSAARRDRKSTRLNSSHVKISYAVFCLKKKRAPS